MGDVIFFTLKLSVRVPPGEDKADSSKQHETDPA